MSFSVFRGSHSGFKMSTRRLLFASIHSYLDPSSGAAMASREVLELLTARGWDCRVLAFGVLDYQWETPLDLALATMELPAARAAAEALRGIKLGFWFSHGEKMATLYGSSPRHFAFE